MPDRDEVWLPGMPCWSDLAVGDLDASRSFYSALLDWTFAQGRDARAESSTALVRGRPVAGLSARTGADPESLMWTVYLATDDIEASAKTAQSAGAREIAAPVSNGAGGWVGRWADPSGGAFGLLQPGGHPGFAVTNENGAPAWCDLMTASYEETCAFYADLFGFRYVEIGLGDGRYALATCPTADLPTSGIGEISGGQSPAWSVAFHADDVDDVVPRVKAAGGRVVTAPYDFEYGRVVEVAGPDGERFCLITPMAEP